MKIKIEIKTMGGSVLFSLEKENNTVKDTMVQAVKEGANLEGAYLRGADLRGAYLRGADLRGAYLEGANLRGAYLEGANLRGADLRGAYLEGADLRGAYLRGADLRGAYLEGADLRGAYLRGADLRGAYLEGANLRGAYLEGADLRGAYLRGAKNIPQSYINVCSRDMLFVFEHLKSELPYLRKKLLSGNVDGTQYEGTCACLIGSLANSKKQNADQLCESIPYYEKGLHNFGEQWFWQIKSGDTPENSFFAKHALELIDSVLGDSHGKQ